MFFYMRAFIILFVYIKRYNAGGRHRSPKLFFILCRGDHRSPELYLSFVGAVIGRPNYIYRL